MADLKIIQLMFVGTPHGIQEVIPFADDPNCFVGIVADNKHAIV